MKKSLLRVPFFFERIQFLFIVTLLLAFATGAVHSEQLPIQAAALEFEARLPTFKQQLPAVIESAETSAYRMLAHPEARLNIPYNEQMGFSEELMGRAGGFSFAAPSAWRGGTTPYDVVLLSVRSWEVQSSLMKRRVAEFKANGWLVTVIGSAQGKPADLGEDFFLDNGAPDAGEKHGRINVLANVALGWMWCCEYASTMSREGWFPGVLYSVGMADMAHFNRSLARPERRYCLLPCEVSIASGDLATLYYERLKKMVGDVKSPHIQKQLSDATDIIAQRMAEGRTVAIAGMGHVILAEVKCDNRAPWLGFRAVNQLEIGFRTHLKKGDLLVWMTYCGMNSRWDNYATHIADSRADLITCYAPNPGGDPPPVTLAHIDQSWAMPDADIPIPVLPNVMAPISGINGTLIARMLDDAVADRLVELGSTPRRPTPEDLDPEYLNYSGMRQWYGRAGAQPELWQGTWQIIDTNGMPVIDKRFEGIRRLSHGRMAAYEQGRWGFVDAEGEWVIEPIYTTVSDFRNRQAFVRTEQGASIIDTSGDPIFPSSYNQLVEITDGRGKRASPTNQLFAEANGLWGVIDRTTGTNIVPLVHSGLLRYADNRLMFQTADRHWGLLDDVGNIIAPATFEEIFPFSGFAATMIKDGKFGGMDMDGNIVVEPIFNYIRSISKDAVDASKDGYSGSMTHAGEPIVPPEVAPSKFKKTQPFGKDRQLALDDSSWGVIGEEGETVVPFVYSDLGTCGDNFLCAKQEGLWGIIDATNNIVIPLRYRKLLSLGDNKMLGRLDGGWTLIDLALGTETDLVDYDFYEPWGKDNFKVMKDGKWGVIARSGEVVIPLEYTFIYGLWKEWIVVAKGGEWDEDPGLSPRLVGRRVGMIDWQNNVVIPCKYEAINPYGFGKDRFAAAISIEDLPNQP